jgi:SAM-dependent methyltransferase
MENSYIDWFPADDTLLKVGERELHTALHNYISDSNRTAECIMSKRKPRIEALEKILHKIDKELSGDVLEIGAGDGWCSAYLAESQQNINSIYIMECNLPAVTRLIPQTFKLLNISTEKVKYVLGSFNNIKAENQFDYIIAMGALHHSSNLKHTLAQVHKALKPGGFLIAQEPYVSDDTQNSFFLQLGEREKEFNGFGKIKNKERSDIFYRKCEYLTAGYHAGFDITLIELDGVLMKNTAANMVVAMQKSQNETNEIPMTAW